MLRSAQLGSAYSASIGSVWSRSVSLGISLACLHLRLLIYRTPIYAPHVAMSSQQVGGAHIQFSLILKEPGHGSGRRCAELRIWHINLAVFQTTSTIQLIFGFPFTLPIRDSIGDLHISPYKDFAFLGFRRPCVATPWLEITAVE